VYMCVCVCVCVFGRPISLLSLLQEIPSPPRYMERKEGRCTALSMSYIKVLYSKCWTVEEEERKKTFSTGKFRYQFYMFPLGLNPAQPPDVCMCVCVYI
jgi:hypothetical protein